MKAWRNIFSQRIILASVVASMVFFGMFSTAQSAYAQIDATRVFGEGVYTPEQTAQIKADPNAPVSKYVPSSGESGLVSTFVNLLIGGLARIAIWLEGFLVTALISMMLFVVKYNGFASARAVSTGWTLVRDIANLFFVVVLLGIALATILRVESYNFKRLLPKLILMAVLVNFSKVIAGLIIDFAQVVMLTFVAAFAGVSGAGNMVTTLQIQSIITYDWSNATNASMGNFTGTALLMVIMLLITIAVLLVMLVVLVMRIVMLWVLVVLSPLAYIMAAFPQGSRYASQWWQEFTKYVIVGPVMAFFLWLTFAVASSGDFAQKDFGSTNSLAATGGGDALSTQLGNQAGVLTEIGSTDNLLSFIIAIAMLMGSLVVTQQIGVAGSQFAGSAFNKIRQTGLKAAMAPIGAIGWAAKTAGKAPFQFVGRKVNEAIGENRLPAWMAPAGMVRGWVARREELYTSARQKSAAAGQEKWEQFFTGTAMPRRTMLQTAEESKFAKEFGFMNKKEMAKTAQDLADGSDSAEARIRKRALVTAAASKGYIDDLMGEKKMQTYVRDYAHELYKDKKTDPRLKQYMDDTGLLKKLDNGGWQGYDQTHLFLQKFIGQNEEGINTIDNIEEIGISIGHPEYAGHATFRTKEEGGHDAMALRSLHDEEYVDSKGNKHLIKSAQSQALTEFNKIKGRGRIPVAPHPLFDFYDDGSIGLSSTSVKFMTAAYGGQGVRVAEHGQVRNLSKLLGGGFDEPQWVRNPDGTLLDHKGEKVADFDFSRAPDPQAALGRTAEAISYFLQTEPDAIAGAHKKIGGNTGEPVFRMNGKIVTAKELTKQYPIERILQKYRPYWSAAADAGSASSGATGPEASPGPTPAQAPGPSAPMADIDIAKHERTKRAIDEFQTTTGLTAADFYQSPAYNPRQHTAEADLERNEQLVGSWRQEIGRLRSDVDQNNPAAVEQAIREEQRKIRGVKSAIGKGEGEQAGIGVDFSDEGVQRIFGINRSQAGAYYKQADLTAEQKTFLKEKYLNQLINEGVADDKATELATGFEETLGKVGSLRLTNNSGYASRLETGRHERAHLEIDKLNPVQIDEIYNSIEGDRRLEMEAEVKARWGNTSAFDLKREILTQGLASYGRSDARGPLQLTDMAAQAMAATGAVKMSGAAQKRLQQAYPEAAVTRGELRGIGREKRTGEKAKAQAAKADQQATFQPAQEQRRQIRQRETQNAPVYTQATSALSKLNANQLGQLWSKLSAAQQSALTQEVQESFPVAGRSVPASDYNLQLTALSRALARTNLEPGAKDNLHLNADIVAEIKSQGVDTEAIGTENRLYRTAQQAQGQYQQRRSEYEQLTARKDNYGETMKQKQTENSAEIRQRNQEARTAAERGDTTTATEARKRAEFLQKDNTRIDRDVAAKQKTFDVDIGRAKQKMQAALDQVVNLETQRRPKPSEQVISAVKQAATASPEARQQAVERLSTMEPEQVIEAVQAEVDDQGQNLKAAVDKGSGNAEIISALTSIESTLTALQSTLEKLPQAQVNQSAKSDLEEAIGQVQQRRSGGTALDPNSTTGLLFSINNSLKGLSRKTGTPTGQAPENLDQNQPS